MLAIAAVHKVRHETHAAVGTMRDAPCDALCDALCDVLCSAHGAQQSGRGCTSHAPQAAPPRTPTHPHAPPRTPPHTHSHRRALRAATVGWVGGMLDESVAKTGVFGWMGRYLLDNDGRYVYERKQQQQQQQQTLRETTPHTAADGEQRGSRNGAARMGAWCAPLIGASGDDSAILGMPFYRANMVVHDRLSRKVSFAAHDGNCAALKCKAAAQTAQTAQTAQAAQAAQATQAAQAAQAAASVAAAASPAESGSGSSRRLQPQRGREGAGGGAIQPGSIDAHQRRRLRVTAAELPYIDLSRLRLPTYFNGSSSGPSWPVRRHVGGRRYSSRRR